MGTYCYNYFSNREISVSNAYKRYVHPLEEAVRILSLIKVTHGHMFMKYYATQ